MVPLNPNVTLAVKDELKRPLFPKDDTLLDTVTSKEFQDLLLTDPTKKKAKTILQNILGLQRNGQKLNVWDRKREKFQILHHSTSTYSYQLNIKAAGTTFGLVFMKDFTDMLHCCLVLLHLRST